MFNGNADPGPSGRPGLALNYNPLLVLLQNWNTITGRDFYRGLIGDSWRYTINLLRNLQAMRSLNAAQQLEALAWWEIQEFHLRVDPNVEGYTGTNSALPDPKTWSNWNAPSQLAVLGANRDLAAK